MEKKTLIIIASIVAIGVIVCIACLCFFMVVGGFFAYGVSQDPDIEAIFNEFGPTPTPVPIINRQVFTESLNHPSTATLLAETDVPVRDLRSLSSRFLYDGMALSEVITRPRMVLAVGDKKTFWITDDSGDEPNLFQSEATLQYVTEHSYWWVENSFTLDAEAIEQSAEIFENKTYPTNREFFGSEWTPGVDKDEHLHIFLGNVPGVSGYYASANEFIKQVAADSNEGEMFFINLNAIEPGEDNFDGVLAHEFQHMIHWYQDRNEETWVNEGLSELASYINGYFPGMAYTYYLNKPDLQLTTWSNDSGQNTAHYGASYLFMLYFLEQFGEDVLKAVVDNSANGIDGFNQTLATKGYAERFDDIFADFVIANYLNNPTLADKQWGYEGISGKKAKLDTSHSQFPIKRSTTVHQYGVDYIKIETESAFTLHFTGSTTVNVLDNQAYSGRYQWYSNRGDDSVTSLTRAFDLSAVSEATLSYWMWYNIEADWDYVYLEVSTNGGKSWEIIKTPNSRTTNPSGNAYGPGYTGQSNGWKHETVDLSPYTGLEILLRFEYITDDAVNAPGFALDDIAIEQIGFFDDMETNDPAWQAAGFIRMDNLLQQRFIVQLISLDDPPTVLPVRLDETNKGQITMGGLSSGQYVLVISAHAPLTTQVAGYQYYISNQ